MILKNISIKGITVLLFMILALTASVTVGYFIFSGWLSSA